MDKGTFVGVLWRRKLLTLLAVALTVGAALFVMSGQRPTFNYSSSLLLVPPKPDLTPDEQRRDTARGNVLFYLESLGQARDLLITTMQSRDLQDQIAKAHPGTAFEIGQDANATAPIVTVTASSQDEQSALALRDDLTEMIPTVLQQLQNGVGVPEDGLVTSHVITNDTLPVKDNKARLRLGIMAAGGVGIVSFFLIAVLDGLLNSRARKRTDPRLRKKRDRGRGSAEEDARESEPEAEPTGRTDLSHDRWSLEEDRSREASSVQA